MKECLKFYHLNNWSSFEAFKPKLIARENFFIICLYQLQFESMMTVLSNTALRICSLTFTIDLISFKSGRVNKLHSF